MAINPGMCKNLCKRDANLSSPERMLFWTPAASVLKMCALRKGGRAVECTGLEF
jgi:hypothetical protein